MNEDMELSERLAQRFRELGPDVVFVHSDIMQGLSVVRPVPFDRARFLANHYGAISEITGSADLWFPTFNYSFSKTRFFDQKSDRSEVGHLSEYVRTKVATWRTPVPVFSISGTGDQPALPADSTMDAFGEGSMFHEMFDRNALIFNYGCNLGSLTFIHYCESLVTSPYRYEKVFRGQILDMMGNEKPICVRFHVRPLNREMTYDWARLQTDLVERNILERVGNDGRKLQIIQTRLLANYWIERLEEEPLFFLTQETVAWIEPMLQELGRAFHIDDFEPTD